MTTEDSIYQFKVPSIEGEEINFSQFEGKKILIVNTASECGFTSQFAQLQELYDNFRDHLVIVGFPANNFQAQEPGSDEQIAEFCQLRYGVTFPLAAKSDVTGQNINPVFKWLTSQHINSGLNKSVTWNFHKFLIDETGKLVAVFPPAMNPLDEEIMSLLNLNHFVNKD
jgi:glutathione peroxidase